jgi:hypothetical protein
LSAKVTCLFLNHIALWALCIVLYGVFILGCDKPASNKSACEGLVYKESGPWRSEYLPCANEMITKLEEMTPLLEATLKGDRKSRKKGVKTLRELDFLMTAAGGIHKMLGGWEDRALGNLNVYITNAYSHYDAFLMVTMIGSKSPAAKPEFEAGQAALEGAKRKYNDL